MRTTKQENLQLALKLFKTIENRKQIEKEESELKEQIKLIMGDETVLEAGEIFISLDERSRTDLDKNKMKEELGLELLKKFEKTSSFKVLSVVKK